MGQKIEDPTITKFTLHICLVSLLSPSLPLEAWMRLDCDYGMEGRGKSFLLESCQLWCNSTRPFIFPVTLYFPPALITYDTR